jgi:hypothetical protein
VSLLRVAFLPSVIVLNVISLTVVMSCVVAPCDALIALRQRRGGGDSSLKVSNWGRGEGRGKEKRRRKYKWRKLELILRSIAFQKKPGLTLRLFPDVI